MMDNTISERQMQYARQEAAGLTDQMKDLVGMEITAVGADVDTEYGWPEVWPWIEVQPREEGAEKFKVFISQDEEGNGGGRLMDVPYRVPAEGVTEQEARS